MQPVNIFGHKIHPAVIGAIATILAAVILLRARSSGAQATAGTVATADPFGLTTGTDQSGTISMLENEISGLQSQLGQLQTAPPAPALSEPPPQGLTQAKPNGFPDQGYGTIPVYSDPNDPKSLVGWLGWQQPITIDTSRQPVYGRATGSGTRIWEPVLVGGLPEWLSLESFSSIPPNIAAVPAAGTTSLQH